VTAVIFHLVTTSPIEGYRFAVDPHEYRVADPDRDQAIGLLRDALVEGRLTLSEFEDRASEANSAKTYAELRGLLADLPITPSALPTPPKPRSTPGNRHLRSHQRSAGARPPVRVPPTAEQRRRSTIASLVALAAIFTGATMMATMPIDGAYADGYAYDPSPITRDEFGAAVLSEKLMLSSGDEYGYEVLRHDGAEGVLRIEAAYANDSIRVKVDTNDEEPGGVRVATYVGIAEVLIPEGSVPVEVSSQGSWSYTFTPLG
jgi:hypothetical protein